MDYIFAARSGVVDTLSIALAIDHHLKLMFLENNLNVSSKQTTIASY